jgi:hypothetical protein
VEEQKCLCHWKLLTLLITENHITK